MKTLPRSNPSNRKTTAFSQIVNIALFALFALITRLYAIVLLQSVVVLVSLLLFRVSIRSLPLRLFLPVMPIVIFVLILNGFRGTGEVLARLGPFVIVKQGILRGVYYSAVILYLWLMSRILTIGCGEKELLLTLSSFSRNKKASGIILILYYVLRIFHNTYGELKVVFRSSGKNMKERVLEFFFTAFEKSKSDFDRLPDPAPGGRSLSVFDLFYIFLEAGVLFFSYLMRSVFVKL